MTGSRQELLAGFVEWVRQHITGDEKGEGQLFLERLFLAFGLPGVRDVGAVFEKRVRQRDSARVSFADLVWKPIVLIEMKKRGTDLSTAFRQAFDYWISLVPNRPRWTVLCNFDEFWIYDFNEDINAPQDTLRLDELAQRYEPLAFLFPTQEQPRFKVNRQEVTQAAADRLTRCYRKLKSRKVDPDTAQRFILQMLISLFSEDIGLLPKHFVTQLLDECIDPPKAFDLLGGLFRAMNNRTGERGGRFKDVPYFNGGIFSTPAPVELHDDEIVQLKEAAKENWAHISPDIFGTIFQHSMEGERTAGGALVRHAFGAHYTTAVDIMKIVGPTIVQPWRAAIEEARDLDRLRQLQQRLYTFTVLDPACGSGNFLYIAYRELKRIEAELVERIQEAAPRGEREQRAFGFVRSKQFFGMDIIPFAVELAKVTMTLAHKLAIDELHADEKPLPLDNLDDNIRCIDALIQPAPGAPGESPGAKWEPTPWPRADVVIGNPPFLGAKRLKPERGAAYVNAVRKTFPDVPGMADYCVYWIRRSHDHLAQCAADDPFRGRAGLVGTQNIRNNQSRVGGLDHVVKSGTIVEAVDNQPWSGEANVHVSIVNWVKHAPPPSHIAGVTDPDAIEQWTKSLLIPTAKKLWQKVDPSSPPFEGTPAARGRKAVTTAGKRGRTRKDKSYELAPRQTDFINSALSDQIDVASARELLCNSNPQRAFQGFTPGYAGFVLQPGIAREFAAHSPRAAICIRPYFIGRELAGADARPTRFIIDADGHDATSLLQLGPIYPHLERTVLPKVRATLHREEKRKSDMVAARREHLERWWTFWARRTELRAWMRDRGRILGASRTQRWPFVFTFISTQIAVGDKLQLFAFDDDYSFGVIQSAAHCLWYKAKGARLKVETDFNYSTRSVFHTFPWPQGAKFAGPTKKQVETVAEAGREIRHIRDQVLPTIKGGLRALYRTLELPGRSALKDAHAALDAAVLDAYGFSPSQDILKQLLDLNHAVAARIGRGEPVIAPGVPPSFGDPAAGGLVTDDCIGAADTA